MITYRKSVLFILCVVSTLVMTATAMAATSYDSSENNSGGFYAFRMGLGFLNDPATNTGIFATSVGMDYDISDSYSVGVEYNVGIGGGSTLSNINMNVGYYVPLVKGSAYGYGRLGYGSTSGGGGLNGGGLVYEIGFEFPSFGLLDIGYKNFAVSSGPVTGSAGGFFIGMAFPF